MKITSKFREMFFFRKIIIFSFVDLFLTLIIYIGCESDSYLMAFIFLIILCFTLYYQYSDLDSVFQITVTDSEIEMVSWFSAKKIIVPFSCFNQIRTYRQSGYSTSKAGQISNGYFESEIEYDNNKKLIVSPDIFENYNEVIGAIRERYNSLMST